MAEKRTGTILFVLLVLSILFLSVCPPIQYRKPLQVKLQIAGNKVNVAETWQEWEIQYENRETETIYSDNILISLQLTAKNFGDNSFVKVRIPIKWKGGLTWPYYAGVETKAKVFIGQAGDMNYLGEVTSATQYFDDRFVVKDSVVFSELWIGGSKAIADLKAKHVGAGEPAHPLIYYAMGFGLGWNLLYEMFHGRALLNIQDLLDKFGGKVPTFNLWIEASQEWNTIGTAGIILDKKTVEFELQAPFNIGRPLTYTAPFTITAGGFTSAGTVYVTVVVPPYTITRTATTYSGLYTTVTVEPTTYSTATTVTLTAGPTALPDWLLAIINWLKSIFGQWWWVVALVVIFVVLWLIFRRRESSTVIVAR